MPVVKVINASRYAFKDAETGRDISGCKVTYLGEAEASDKFKGLPVITLTGDEQIYHAIPRQFPCDLEIETTIVMKQGKPSVKLSGVKALVK